MYEKVSGEKSCACGKKLRKKVGGKKLGKKIGESKWQKKSMITPKKLVGKKVYKVGKKVFI
jgi:hypothetical protein